MTVAATFPLPSGRTTRLFVKTPEQVALFTERAQAWFMDEGDRAREQALREALSHDIVYVDAHAGIEPADVQHVFVRVTANIEMPRIFACAIATQARVEKMLESEPCVVETFSFQVSSGRLVTPAGTIAAFEAWFERVFPDMTLPAMCFAGVSESVDELVEADWSDIPGEASDELPTEVFDVASLVAVAA